VSFLIDTNHADFFYREDPRIVRRLREAPHSLVWFSAITLGELEAGHGMNPTTDPERRNSYNQWIRRWLQPKVIELGVSTAIYYGNVMGNIWKIVPPANDKIPTEKHLLSLKVDVNDAWSVAVAWERNLTFVTTDGMDILRKAVPQVKFDSWL
jgi:predicted nucleic acid-binding protein